MGQLTHDALYYAGDDEFVAGLVPFLRDGLARGEAAAAAVTRPHIDLLREALGGDAGAVWFVDRDEWYQRPTGTIAGWRRVLADANSRGHSYVRIVGEVGFGPSDRHPTWIRYESAVNRVFAQAPAWIVCPYDTRRLPPSVLADARRTHPVVADPRRRPSDRYLPPEVLLRSVPEPMPPVTGPPVLELRLMLDDTVTSARHTVDNAVATGGWLGPGRLDDLLLALTEVAGNSVRYGAGRRQLRLWAPGWGVVCEVADEGPGPANPLVGYCPPEDLPERGQGLWIAQQVCDRLSIEHRDGVTRVRFTIRSREPSL
jgi:anti-sigma regulatory factor (Ser/Thr protein kinase)